MTEVNRKRTWTMRPDSARAAQAQTTRSVLLAHARALFGTHGYHAVGVRDITCAAGLTRGALAHHFGGKEDVFVAVFDEVEREIAGDTARPDVELAGKNGWERFRAGVETYLDAALRPETQRIVFIDGPAVLGWQRWRAIEQDHYLGMMVKSLQKAANEGALPPLPVTTLAHLIFASVTEGALMIAHAPDPDACRREVRATLECLFNGLG